MTINIELDSRLSFLLPRPQPDPARDWVTPAALPSWQTAPARCLLRRRWFCRATVHRGVEDAQEGPDRTLECRSATCTDHHPRHSTRPQEEEEEEEGVKPQLTASASETRAAATYTSVREAPAAVTWPETVSGRGQEDARVNRRPWRGSAIDRKRREGRREMHYSGRRVAGSGEGKHLAKGNGRMTNVGGSRGTDRAIAASGVDLTHEETKKIL